MPWVAIGIVGLIVGVVALVRGKKGAGAQGLPHAEAGTGALDASLPEKDAKLIRDVESGAVKLAARVMQSLSTKKKQEGFPLASARWAALSKTKGT